MEKLGNGKTGDRDLMRVNELIKVTLIIIFVHVKC